MTTILPASLVREIASRWHGGLGCPLYAFLSTGAIRPGLVTETLRLAAWALARGDREDARDLDALAGYCEATGERGPIAGWHKEHF